MFEWILMHCCSPIPDLCENYQFMLITLLAGVCAPCSGFLHHYSLNKNKLFRKKLFFFPPFTPTTKVCFYNQHIINAYNITSIVEPDPGSPVEPDQLLCILLLLGKNYWDSVCVFCCWGESYFCRILSSQREKWLWQKLTT